MGGLIRTALTIKQLAADYLDRHAVPKKRARSAEGDRSMLDRIILPRLGRKNVSEVTFGLATSSPSTSG
jgi:hypothetical protein